jgi:cytoskeletal protein RodZ
MARSRLAALLVALALLAPASAFAQSAGDEQYADPFGGDQSQSDNQGSSSDQGSSSGGGTTTAQAAPTATPAPATSAPTATTAQAAPAAPQLPRTGGDPITPAVAGFWLLLGGVALRARVRPR